MVYIPESDRGRITSRQTVCEASLSLTITPYSRLLRRPHSRKRRLAKTPSTTGERERDGSGFSENANDEQGGDIDKVSMQRAVAQATCVANPNPNPDPNPNPNPNPNLTLTLTLTLSHPARRRHQRQRRRPCCEHGRAERCDAILWARARARARGTGTGRGRGTGRGGGRGGDVAGLSEATPHAFAPDPDPNPNPNP